MKKYKHLVYAGTFDRLHVGHKKLLDKAFELGEKVSLAITAEKLYKSKLLSDQILDWEQRKSEVEEYLSRKKVLKRVVFFKLDDVFGSSITDRSMDAILVTELTEKNAQKINEMRIKNKLKPLKIIVEKLVRGDDGAIVSSERIRMGEIDRNGQSFRLSVIGNQSEQLILPKELREELRKPLGKVISGSVNQLSDTARVVIKSIKSIKSKVTMIISVGDIVTNSLLRVGFDPDLKIIDFRSRRKEVTETVTFNTEHKTQKKFKNEPGTINIKTTLEIQKTIKEFIYKQKKQLLSIEGEEGLLALPAILFAPLGSIVLYGQFDRGVVVVDVTEEKKKDVANLLGSFT